MQGYLFFPRRRSKHWAHVSEAVRGPRCLPEQSSVYICVSKGAGGPATCPWHLPREASPPPANQKNPSPVPPILSQGSTKPVLPKRSPPPLPPHPRPTDDGGPGGGGRRHLATRLRLEVQDFSHLPPPSPRSAPPIVMQHVWLQAADARWYSPQLCEDVASAGY